MSPLAHILISVLVFQSFLVALHNYISSVEESSLLLLSEPFQGLPHHHVCVVTRTVNSTQGGVYVLYKRRKSPLSNLRKFCLIIPTIFLAFAADLRHCVLYFRSDLVNTPKSLSSSIISSSILDSGFLSCDTFYSVYVQLDLSAEILFKFGWLSKLFG